MKPVDIKGLTSLLAGQAVVHPSTSRRGEIVKAYEDVNGYLRVQVKWPDGRMSNVAPGKLSLAGPKPVRRTRAAA